MATQLVEINSEDPAAGPIPERGHTALLERVIEVFAVCARAQAAAWHYEELTRLSDQELAVRGLKRANLPRVAFHILAEGAQASQ